MSLAALDKWYRAEAKPLCAKYPTIKSINITILTGPKAEDIFTIFVTPVNNENLLVEELGEVKRSVENSVGPEGYTVERRPAKSKYGPKDCPY